MKASVLLLDDDLSSITHVIDYLSDYFEVSACDNENDFFELSSKKHFDMFLLDINMPKSSGLEICKRLKNDSLLKYIPVIFVTAYSDIQKIEKGFALGAADYIVKPFKTEELRIRIKAHIKNSIVQKKLRKEHLKLHMEIESLTQELIESEHKTLNENNFQNREKVFQQTNSSIEQRKKTT